MDFLELLDERAMMASVKATSKKHLLHVMAERAAVLYRLDVGALHEALLRREALGSTGVGHGVAIPHAKLQGVERMLGLFAHLDRPIAFEAIDEEPVDLVFMLLAPEGAGADHLKALAKVARVLRDPAFAGKLRGTHDPAGLHSLFLATARPDAA